MRFQMKWRSWVRSRAVTRRNSIPYSFSAAQITRTPEMGTGGGRLRDCQVEIPETSYRQHQCAAEFAPALGQVKGHPVANMLEAICC